MPYKNISDRRAAYRRWFEKHKERETVKLKRKSRDRARWKFLEPQNCSISNCNQIGERHHIDYRKPLEIIWICKEHHEALHSTPMCVIDGCKNKHLARGLCNRHYKQWKKTIS